jgi:L-ascorbate metabolism protein UlaG (beta-lactamase superfamily)
LTDRDHTLWASWAIIGDKHRVFFTGDTGYFAAFKDIGERLGPFNVSMVEAGAYDRLWPHIHLGPEGALKTHRDLGAGVLLPVHWGTFNLAMHSWTEPIKRLAKLAEENKVKLAQPAPGQSFEPHKELPNSRWWNQGQ